MYTKKSIRVIYIKLEVLSLSPPAYKENHEYVVFIVSIYIYVFVSIFILIFAKRMVKLRPKPVSNKPSVLMKRVSQTQYFYLNIFQR